MSRILRIKPRALQQFKKIIGESGGGSLKLSLKSGGCNGFEYKIEATNNEVEKGDEVIRLDGVELVVCGKSLLYILGTSIDYSKSIMGETFVFENPNASSTCGCGSSFNAME